MRSNLVCVQAFGDFSWTAVKRADVTGFEAGLRMGYHQKKKQQAFQRGMFELLTYLQVMKLLKKAAYPSQVIRSHPEVWRVLRSCNTTLKAQDPQYIT